MPTDEELKAKIVEFFDWVESELLVSYDWLGTGSDGKAAAREEKRAWKYFNDTKSIVLASLPLPPAAARLGAREGPSDLPKPPWRVLSYRCIPHPKSGYAPSDQAWFAYSQEDGLFTTATRIVLKAITTKVSTTSITCRKK